MRHALGRLAQTLPVFVIISILVFALSHLTPGDPITAALKGQVPESALQQIRHDYGLDLPLSHQYVLWLRNLASGNWGISITYKVPVFAVLWPAFINTLALTATSVAVCLVMGTSLGMISGLNDGRLADRLLMLVIQIGHNTPVVLLGLLLIWVFGVELDWLPVFGTHDVHRPWSVGDAVRHLLMPTLAAAIMSMLVLARLVRSAVIDIAASDYIRTYRSQGFPWAHILFRHFGRNLLVPVISITGLQIGFLLSGVLFVENVFAWPGIGTQLYNAIAGKDYPMIQAGVMLVTAIFLLTNITTDLIIDMLDTRRDG